MKIPSAIALTIGLIAVAAALALFLVRDIGIRENEALRKVQALSEVQEFMAELEKNGKTASFNIEDRGSAWSVQVYEIVTEGDVSHTATFNWYHVDKKAGAVAKEFE